MKRIFTGLTVLAAACDRGRAQEEGCSPLVLDAVAAEDVASLCDDGCPRVVEGAISVVGTDLEDLRALSCVTAVGDVLLVQGNERLVSFDGLVAERIGGLYVDSNPSLVRVGGFASGTEDHIGFLGVFGNEALEAVTLPPQIGAIDGSVVIEDAPALTSIDLSSVTQLGGPFAVNRTGLGSLDGAPAITEIAGDLSISENPALVSLAGLETLATVTGSVGIRNNAALGSFEGLESLTTVGESFVGFPTGAPMSTEGLESLVSVGLDLDLAGTGLGTAADGNGPSTLVGLSSLTHVGRDLSVENLTGLETLDGLQSMRTIGGALTIQATTVRDVSALHDLETVGGDVLVKWNFDLSEAKARALAAEIGTVGGSVTIECNEGCS